MTLGKARQKIALSFSTRRIRLGVSHNSAPSSYMAPSKDHPEAPPAREKKQRR